MMVRLATSVRSFPRVIRILGACAALSPAVWGSVGCGGVSDKSIKDVSVVEARRLFDAAQRPGRASTLAIVDPRSPRDFAAGHIPGARNIRLADMPTDAPIDRRLDSADAILVYGTNPASIPARAMTKRLLALGYSGVRFMPGGLVEWERAGGPVNRLTPPEEAAPAAQD